QAEHVKSDLLRDGDAELAAFSQGKVDLLVQGDTGRRLSVLGDSIAKNNASGITESWKNYLSSVTVGHLADPNDNGVQWCVEEVGTSTLSYRSAAENKLVGTSSLKFDNRYWLVLGGSRYLILDAQVSNSGG